MFPTGCDDIIAFANDPSGQELAFLNRALMKTYNY